MARAKKNPGPGHNSEPLTEDEIASLEALFSQKIRAKLHAFAEAKAVADAARQEVNDEFALVKGELRISRKDFEAFMAKQDLSEAEFAHEFEKEMARYRRHGMPVGAQQDMFVGDTVDDQVVARADGKRAGLRGADPKPPTYISGVLVQDWMEGYHAGQSELCMRLDKGGALLAARQAAAKAATDAGKLQAGEYPDEEEVDEEEEIDHSAKALKKSGWMEPAEDEAEFAEAAA